MSFDPAVIESFDYLGYDVDAARRELRCSYRLGSYGFTEIVSVPGGDWRAPGVDRACRLVHLLAGVSYYKAAAPPVIDFGAHGLTAAEANLLRSFYIDGLGEYAYRNALDLSGVEFRHASQSAAPIALEGGAGPLVPFGGGLDSIVSIEVVRSVAEPALFVMSRPGDHYQAIEDVIDVVGLPVVRAGREIDPLIRRSSELGFRNGHVPITGVLSAIAVLAAVVHGRSEIVMSNEWSASMGNVSVGGRLVNHQYSKSLAFETAFRAALHDSFGDTLDYFSLLRPLSELRIARYFAGLTDYHSVFRSCNRAFHLNPDHRLDHWCGECDKCCFIDLITAPYLPAAVLDRVFDGHEPLRNPSNEHRLRTLLGVTDDYKPFECVGDVNECRAAAVLAAQRSDRANDAVLRRLASAAGEVDTEALLSVMPPHYIPARYAATSLLG